MQPSEIRAIWLSQAIAYLAGVLASLVGYAWAGRSDAWRWPIVGVLVLAIGILTLLQGKAIKVLVSASGAVRTNTRLITPVRASAEAPQSTPRIETTSTATLRKEEKPAPALSETSATETRTTRDPSDPPIGAWRNQSEPLSQSTNLNSNPDRHPATLAIGDLLDVWETSLIEGDDLLAALRRCFAKAGQGTVRPGEDIGAGSYTVAIDLGDRGELILLPTIGATLRGVADWFFASGSGASRLARVQRVLEPAIVRRSSSGLERLQMGSVE